LEWMALLMHLLIRKQIVSLAETRTFRRLYLEKENLWIARLASRCASFMVSTTLPTVPTLLYVTC
jgi:hypothetical protein